MATHHGDKSRTVEALTYEVLNHMEHNYPRSWAVQDIQFLLDVIREKDEVHRVMQQVIHDKDEEIRKLKSGDYFVHY